MLIKVQPVSKLCTHSVSHAHFSDTFSLRCAQTTRTRMAQGVCCAHVFSLHLILSILMFHPPSVLFSDGHFETTFPTLTSALSLPNYSRSESAGQAHFRTSGGEFGYLADPTHSTNFTSPSKQQTVIDMNENICVRLIVSEATWIRQEWVIGQTFQDTHEVLVPQFWCFGAL